MKNMKNNSEHTEYQLQTFTYPVPSTNMSQLPNDFPVSYQPNHARLGFLCASSQRWWCFVRFWRQFFYLTAEGIWFPFSVEICIILGRFGVIFRFHVIYKLSNYCTNYQIIVRLQKPEFRGITTIFFGDLRGLVVIIVTTPNHPK